MIYLWMRLFKFSTHILTKLWGGGHKRSEVPLWNFEIK